MSRSGSPGANPPPEPAWALHRDARFVGFSGGFAKNHHNTDTFPLFICSWPPS